MFIWLRDCINLTKTQDYINATLNESAHSNAEAGVGETEQPFWE